jgi:hypothetical protein
LKYRIAIKNGDGKTLHVYPITTNTGEADAIRMAKEDAVSDFKLSDEEAAELTAIVLDN